MKSPGWQRWSEKISSPHSSVLCGTWCSACFDVHLTCAAAELVCRTIHWRGKGAVSRAGMMAAVGVRSLLPGCAGPGQVPVCTHSLWCRNVGDSGEGQVGRNGDTLLLVTAGPAMGTAGENSLVAPAAGSGSASGSGQAGGGTARCHAVSHRLWARQCARLRPGPAEKAHGKY